MTVRAVFLRNLALLLAAIVIYVGAMVLNLRLVGGGCALVAIGITGGVLLLSGLFLAWGASLSRADLVAVERLEQGERPRTGQLAAATGVVRAVGPILESPLTATPCVAYEYSVHLRTRRSSDSGGRTSRHLCYEGFHLTPSVLEGPSARVRLLAMPSLEEYVQENPEEDRARALAERLGASAKVSFPQFLFSRFRTLAGSEEVLARDWCLRKLESWGTGVELDERALSPDVEACAIGIWDENGPALRSPYLWRRVRMSMEPGSPAEVASRLHEGATQLGGLARWCLLAAALLLAVPPLAALFWP